MTATIKLVHANRGTRLVRHKQQRLLAIVGVGHKYHGFRLNIASLVRWPSVQIVDDVKVARVEVLHIVHVAHINVGNIVHHNAAHTLQTDKHVDIAVTAFANRNHLWLWTFIIASDIKRRRIKISIKSGHAKFRRRYLFKIIQTRKFHAQRIGIVTRTITRQSAFHFPRRKITRAKRIQHRHVVVVIIIRRFIHHQQSTEFLVLVQLQSHWKCRVIQTQLIHAYRIIVFGIAFVGRQNVSLAIARSVPRDPIRLSQSEHILIFRNIDTAIDIARVHAGETKIMCAHTEDLDNLERTQIEHRDTIILLQRDKHIAIIVINSHRFRFRVEREEFVRFRQINAVG
mmetsp:Transcript_41608/g.68468  ORF Transcript_41608/g.68468 Transcript_41608/m.68468 type:complete len:342 (+) Transcript_41608:1458-2483(+)